MSVIVTGMDMPKACLGCNFHYAVYDYCKIKHEFAYVVRGKDDCPLKSVEGLIRKLLEEIDGGTDDKWLRYGDIVERIPKIIKQYCGMEET